MPENAHGGARGRALNFFNIGFLEIAVILVLALVLFGPDKLLVLGNSLRKAFNEFQRTASGLATSVLEQSEASEQEPQEERAEFLHEVSVPRPEPDSQDKIPRDEGR